MSHGNAFVPDRGFAQILSEQTGEREHRSSDRSALIQRAAEGDTKAFDRLIRHYGTTVLKIASHYLGNTEDARDVSQEVFLKLYKHLGKFDPRRPFEPWLYRLTMNTCRDFWKRNGRRRSLEDSDAPESIADCRKDGNPFRRLRIREERELIQLALTRLPEKEREAIILRDLEELSTSEVAEILGSSESTVRSQISRGRLRMKEAIEKLVGDQR